MSQGEDEYEVESITQARVDRKRKKLIWKYCVRWKGYGIESDTWEPAESFEGSEDIILRFWERANVNGRDYRDMSLFTAGEVFLPTGPPRRRQKRKQLTRDRDASPQPSPQAESSKRYIEKGLVAETKRRRSTSVEGKGIPDEGPSKKRTRGNNDGSPPGLISPQNQSKRMPPPGRSNHQTLQGSVAPSPGSRRQQKKHTRTSSFDEVIPASDEEEMLRKPPKKPESRQTKDTIDLTSNTSISLQSVNLDIDDRDMARPENEPDTSIDGDNLPFHRARIANPLVKMVENPGVMGMDSAIPVKTRLSGPRAPQASSSKTSASKPGPGRSSSGFLAKRENKSSLLVSHKGTLKTIKGKYSKRMESEKGETSDSQHENGSLWGDDDNGDEEISGRSDLVIAQAPPTSEELLKLAGLVAQNVNTLPDFEDDDIAPSTEIPKTTQEPQTPPLPAPQSDEGHLTSPETENVISSLQQSLTLAKDKLFPSGATGVMNTLNAAWKRSTIFGPLGLGSESQAKLATVPSESAHSSPFILNFDSSVSIPVVLTDASPSPSGSPSLDFIVGKRGPPGKFYNNCAAVTLLDTLRTGGPSAKVLPDLEASDDQKVVFDQFRSRLQSGDLFVAMAGVEVLAFCSSNNTSISQRLNISASLLGHSDDVLVSRVIIEDYSAYAEAATGADSQRWSQYLK